MRAQDLDPLSPVINQTLADALFQSGKENLAIQMLQKQIAFDSGFAGAHEALGKCMVWQGRPSEAIPELEKAHQLYGNTSGWGFCGFAYARAGRTADARNLLDQLLRLEEQGKSVTMEVALVYHGLGDHARALDYLEKAAQDRAISLWQLKSSPFWRDLRSNPRAQAILRKMNLVK